MWSAIRVRRACGCGMCRPTATRKSSRPAAVHYLNLRFSQDGNYLTSNAARRAARNLNTFTAHPCSEGLRRSWSPTSIPTLLSPDGKQFAFLRYNDPNPDQYRLIVEGVDGGGEKILASGPHDRMPVRNRLVPRRKKLSFCVVLQPEGALTGLLATDVSTGRQQIFAKSNGIWATWRGCQMAAASYFCPATRLPITRVIN